MSTHTLHVFAGNGASDRSPSPRGSPSPTRLRFEKNYKSHDAHFINAQGVSFPAVAPTSAEGGRRRRSSTGVTGKVKWIDKNSYPTIHQALEQSRHGSGVRRPSGNPTQRPSSGGLSQFLPPIGYRAPSATPGLALDRIIPAPVYRLMPTISLQDSERLNILQDAPKKPAPRPQSGLDKRIVAERLSEWERALLAAESTGWTDRPPTPPPPPTPSPPPEPENAFTMATVGPLMLSMSRMFSKTMPEEPEEPEPTPMMKRNWWRSQPVERAKQMGRQAAGDHAKSWNPNDINNLRTLKEAQELLLRQKLEMDAQLAAARLEYMSNMIGEMMSLRAMEDARREVVAARVEVERVRREADEARQTELARIKREQEIAEMAEEERQQALAEERAIRDKLNAERKARETSLFAFASRKDEVVGWLGNARKSIGRKQKEARAAKIAAKMKKMEEELQRNMDEFMALKNKEIAEANVKLGAAKERAEKRAEDLRLKRLKQLRRSAEARDRVVNDYERRGKRYNADKGPRELLSFRKLSAQPKEDRLGPSKEERDYLVAQQTMLDNWLAAEKPAIEAGFQSPHIVILSDKFCQTDSVMSDRIRGLFRRAMLKEAPDGRPVYLVETQWTDDLKDVVARIELAIRDNVASYHPRAKSRAHSVAFFLNNDHGSLFLTEKDLTSTTTLYTPEKQYVAVQYFWNKINALLTCYGPESEEHDIGDRTDVRVNFLHSLISSSIHGQDLQSGLSTMLQCQVNSVMSVGAEGKKTFSQYVDYGKYQEAFKAMQDELRVNRLGYDQDEGERMKQEWDHIR